MSEIWKSVTNFEGFYEVSNIGRVRSIDRVKRDVQGLKKFKGQLIKPWVHKSGHLYVRLHGDGIKLNRQVHQLVAEAFIGPYPSGKEVCHNDGNPLNNNVDNLRYDTRTLNIEDRRLHQGYLRRGKISNENIIKIFDMKSNGFRICDIGISLSISPSDVTRILNGTRYSDITRNLGLI